MPAGICSYCQLDFYNCRCEQFHPVINLVKGDSILFSITELEADALYDYFLRRAGYISFEFDPLVHAFCKRLERYVKSKS